MLNKRLNKMKFKKIAILSRGLVSIPFPSQNKPIDVLVIGAGAGVGSVGLRLANQKAMEHQELYFRTADDLVQPYSGTPTILEANISKNINTILLKNKLDLTSLPVGEYNPKQHKKLGKGGKAQKRSHRNNKFHK